MEAEAETIRVSLEDTGTGWKFVRKDILEYEHVPTEE